MLSYEFHQSGASLMKYLLVVILLLGFSTATRADCPVADIEKALAVPLEGLRKVERAVTDVQSTEGGVWRIYRRKDGRLTSLLRIDGGESGMSERRLSIVSPKAYGIAVTRVDYLRHAFIDNGGPNGTAKRTTEYFYYCGGKLYVPPMEYATLDGAVCTKAGEDAQKAITADKDVADVTKGLKQ